jgi:hypothetical protein
VNFRFSISLRIGSVGLRERFSRLFSSISGSTNSRTLARTFVRPPSFANKMQQRLMLGRSPLRRRYRRHRFNALALARHHQTQAIILKRFGPVGMPDYARQPFDIGQKTRVTVARSWQTHFSLPIAEV